jgi:uncharacterized protein YjiS (DUF1127 family)
MDLTLHSPGNGLSRFLPNLGRRLFLRRSVRQLEELDDHMLADIGLARDNIREALDRAQR